MRFALRAVRRAPQSGFTLVEVLVAAVIFAGVFLMLFTLLGRVLANSSGADLLRAATLADLRLARFHEGFDDSTLPDSVSLDGIRFHVLVTKSTEERQEIMRLVILRESSGDTLAVFYGVRYVRQD